MPAEALLWKVSQIHHRQRPVTFSILLPDQITNLLHYYNCITSLTLGGKTKCAYPFEMSQINQYKTYVPVLLSWSLPLPKKLLKTCHFLRGSTQAASVLLPIFSQLFLSQLQLNHYHLFFSTANPTLLRESMEKLSWSAHKQKNYRYPSSSSPS